MSGKILFIHDDADLAEVKASYLSKQLGYEVIPVTTAKEAMRFISRRLSEIDSVVVHKDMGQYSGERYSGRNSGWVDDIVEAIHENNEAVRIGIISGEYPDGLRHVLDLEADFYLETADTVREEEWFFEQLKKGPTSPEEISKRGKEVVTPGNSSSAERGNISSWLR